MRVFVTLAVSFLLIAAATAGAATASRTDSPNHLDCKLLRAALGGTRLGSEVPHFGGHTTGCQYDDGKPLPDLYVTFSMVRDLSVGDAQGYWKQEYHAWKKTSSPGFSGPYLAVEGEQAAAWGVDKLFWWHLIQGKAETTSVVFTKGRYYCELNLHEPVAGSAGRGLRELIPVLKKLGARTPRS